MTIKEDRIRAVALLYYSRKDVQQAIYNFCLNRETIPEYGTKGFGKRPNALDYPSEVIALAKNNATSFHCSEERWGNPLEISKEMSKEELDNFRIGWDLVIDIDSKYFDYAKKAAVSIVRALEFHNVRNFSIKFSGSKGFHILVPWEAFPKSIGGIETRKAFPDWPRIILDYLKEISRPILEKEIERDPEYAKDLKEMKRGIRCEQCGNIAHEFYRISIKCPQCKREEAFNKEISSKYRKRKCPDCNVEFEEIFKKKIHKCLHCNTDSLNNPESFSAQATYDIFEQLGLDVILVSSRHLFRTPYSLHEKTALASIVIDKDKINTFQHKDADPLRVSVRPFLVQAEKDEAKQLLIQALDWHKNKEIERKKQKTEEKQEKEIDKKNFKEINLDYKNLKHPPSIERILKGLVDGRKRALFILLNYFRSLNFNKKDITGIIDEWNKKNKKPLREGYIKSQLEWHFKQKKVLPPNYDKPYYKDIGIPPTEEELRYKNPVSFTLKEFFKHKKSAKKTKKKQKK